MAYGLKACSCHPLTNFTGCQFVKELCIRHYCMCTNPWKRSLPCTFKTTSLLKDVRRMICEHALLAVLILLSMSQRNVLGIELFWWWPHDCGTLEKVYLRSQILERPSIGEYWNIYGVPVLPKM